MRDNPLWFHLYWLIKVIKNTNTIKSFLKTKLWIFCFPIFNQLRFFFQGFCFNKYCRLIQYTLLNRRYRCHFHFPHDVLLGFVQSFHFFDCSCFFPPFNGVVCFITFNFPILFLLFSFPPSFSIFNVPIVFAPFIFSSALPNFSPSVLFIQLQQKAIQTWYLSSKSSSYLWSLFYASIQMPLIVPLHSLTLNWVVKSEALPLLGPWRYSFRWEAFIGKPGWGEVVCIIQVRIFRRLWGFSFHLGLFHWVVFFEYFEVE